MHKQTYEENIKSITEIQEQIDAEERRAAHETEMQKAKNAQPWRVFKNKGPWSKQIKGENK